MNTADALVHCLRDQGVENVFGVPGEETLALVDAFREHDMRVVATRHEQQAAFLAANLGRLGSVPGVCFSTLGPGATNLLTGVSYAQLGRMPLIAITGQKPLRNNEQGQFQRLDIVRTFEPHTQWAATLQDPERVVASVHAAVKASLTGRRGAALIELPQDIARTEVDVRPCASARRHPPVPSPAALDEAARIIERARRPLLVLGSGANDPQLTTSLARLVERTGLKALCTQMGHGALPADNPNLLGALGVHARDYIHVALDAADAVVAIGYDLAEHPPGLWTRGGKCTLIHVDRVVADTDPDYVPEVEVVGDLATALAELTERLPARDDDSWLTKVRAGVRAHLEREATDVASDFPLHPSTVVSDVRAALDVKDVVALDNGLYKIFFARAYPTLAPQTLLMDNVLATMGAGLATAMAAAMHDPSRRAVAVCGDGGLLMNVQDLETLARLQLDVAVVVLRDDAYGFIRYKAAADGFPEHTLKFGNPDFTKLAESFGLRACSVTRAGQLASTLRDELARGGPVLIDCPIAYPDELPTDRDLSAAMRREMW